MTQKAKGILEKAIQKAIDGGWSAMYQKGQPVTFYLQEGIEGDWETLELHASHALEPRYEDMWSVREFIFNHDFAKALWGDYKFWQKHEHIRVRYHSSYSDDRIYMSTRLNAWEYHLQNMVIAEDPIKYLGENI